MRISRILLIITLGLALLFAGCGGNVAPEEPPAPPDGNRDNSDGTDGGPSARDDRSLAGIRLGDGVSVALSGCEDVEDQGVTQDEAGYVGEPWRTYVCDDKFSVVVGEESEQVLWVRVFSPEITTARGIKVGDRAADVFAAYRGDYEEARSRHSGETLPGWFIVGENDELLLFEFEDGGRTNSGITEDSKVQSIELTNWGYFD